MRRMKQTLAAALCLTVLTSLASPRKAEAQFAVFDADIGFDDAIGSWTVAVDALEVGDQAWKKPGGKVIAAECRVLPIDDVGFASLTR